MSTLRIFSAFICIFSFQSFSIAQYEGWHEISKHKFPAVDSKNYCLFDFDDTKALVLVFTRNTCPIAVDYEERLNEISTLFSEKEAVIISINVDEGPGESLEDMIRASTESKFKFKYFHDPKKILAKAFKAKTTPHVFVLNQDREVVYQGLIDSDFDQSNVPENKRYLLLAIKSIISSKNEVCPKNTIPKGCSIRY